MKKFMGEFKKFINRGNVVDMAVGVIVGSSFTAIVNSLSNNILKPIINWLLAMIFGADSLSEIYTFLRKVETTQEVLNDAGEVIGTEVVPDMTQSIYIDWGTFINAVINFFLIAIVLFTIVKMVNKIRSEHKELTEAIAKKRLTKEQRRELRAAAVNLRDKKAVETYFAEKKRREAEAEAKKALEAQEAARREREANPTVEALLGQILTELKKRS